MKVRAELVWTASDTGYIWTSKPVDSVNKGHRAGGKTLGGKVRGTTYLIAKQGQARAVGRQYRPFIDSPALFMEFSQLGNDASNFCAFADRYGLLGRSEGCPSGRARETPPAFPHGPDDSESLEWWTHESAVMAWGVGLWLGLKQADEDQLQSLLDAGPPGGMYGDEHQVTGNNAVPLAGSRMQGVRDAINAKFEQILMDDPFTQAEAALGRLYRVKFKGAVGLKFNWANPPGHPELVLEPVSLLAAMWLQFAFAIIGQKEFPTCRTCGRPFEVSVAGDARQARRLFCSDACKTRAYRERKARALELKKEGKTAKEIAAQLETELATVKAWIRNVGGA